jgi:hypothetical protein
MQERQVPRRGRGSVVGGLVLVVVGLLWFLNNLGYLPADIWHSLWRFWPVILIILGLEVALRGFPDRVALPVLLLGVIAVLSGVLTLAPTLPADDLLRDSFRQQVGDLDVARVELEVDHATLTVESLDGEPNVLAAGQFKHDSSIAIEREFTESSGRGTLKLADRYESFLPFFFLGDMRNDWILGLSTRFPLELNLTGDECDLDLRLEGLNLTALVVRLDDCTWHLALPAHDGLDVELSLSEAELIMEVPAAIGARMRLELDEAQLTVDPSRFAEISPTEYLSQGYDQATATTNIDIKARESSVTVP